MFKTCHFLHEVGGEGEGRGIGVMFINCSGKIVILGFTTLTGIDVDGGLNDWDW